MRGNLWEGVHLEDLSVDGSGLESNSYIALVTIFTKCFNIQKLRVFRRRNAYVLRIILARNSHYSPTRHSLVDLYNVNIVFTVR